MIKKIKCKIISSVSFNSDRSSIAADKEFVQADQESGCFAFYTSLLSESKKEPGTDRERFNFLA